MAGAPKGNKNAEKHGFYADVLTPEETQLYDAAQYATLGDEVAVGRIKLNRLLKYMAEGNEVAEGTIGQMDRMLGRIGDLEVKRSIIERNRAETGQGDDGDFERLKDLAERTSVHKVTFKPNGRTNGKSNGS